jgi:diguanylate cyclase (GGDEF)-like protein
VEPFEREQQIFENAVKHAKDIECGKPQQLDEFNKLVDEYGRMLRYLRKMSKLTDNTESFINGGKLGLISEVHQDSLTGIYNRRYMEFRLDEVIKSCSRAGRWLSVLMVDIDFFKDFNDTYGNVAGDTCLRLVAEELDKDVSRDTDFIARYGGEEFIVVLPDTDSCGACAVATRLLKSIRRLNIPHEHSKVASFVTVSVGAATGRAAYTLTGKDFVERADEALYLSKHSGRDQYTSVMLA